MADNSDKLNETFKKSAEDFSMLPPADVWKNVELDIRKRERRRRFIIFFFAGAGLLICAMLLFPVPTEHNKSALQQENKSETPASIQHTPSSIQQNSIAGQKNSTSNNTTREQNIIAPKSQEKTGVENKKSTAPILVKQEKQNAFAGEIDLNNNIDAKNIITEQAQTTVTTDVVTSKPVVQDTATPAGEPVVVVQSPLPVIIPLADTLSAVKDTLLTTSNSRWSVALGISPALSFSHSKEDNEYQYVAQYRDSTDKNLLTFNVHANLAYKLNSRVEIFSGLSLVNFKQDILQDQVVYQYTPAIISGPTPQPMIVSRNYFHINGDSLQPVKNKYTFLEIPFGIHYNMLTVRKFSILLQPHIAFNTLIRSSGYIYDYDSRQYRQFVRKDMRGFNFSYGGGVAFRYALRPNLFFELTPGYQAFHFPFHHSSFSQKFQQAELRFSLRYYLPE